MDNDPKSLSNQDEKQPGAAMLQPWQFPSGIIRPLMLAATPTVAAGDQYYSSANGIFARLPIGTTGQVLTVSSGLPSWATPTTPTIGTANLADGAVTTIKIADANVTNAKLASVWANFTTTFAGFSADPTPATMRWMQLGKVVYVNYTATANGTSNTTGLTMTLPVAAAQTQRIHCIGRAVDGGAIVLTGGPMVVLTAASATATFYKDPSEGNWTNTNLKSINFQFFYEVA